MLKLPHRLSMMGTRGPTQTRIDMGLFREPLGLQRSASPFGRLQNSQNTLASVPNVADLQDGRLDHIGAAVSGALHQLLVNRGSLAFGISHICFLMSRTPAFA